MSRCLLWVAMSRNRFTFQVWFASRKWERLGWVCSLDRGNLAACGHWWHLCVHFQYALGKPSRKTFRYRQKWSFLKASEEIDKWLYRRERGAREWGNRGDITLWPSYWSFCTRIKHIYIYIYRNQRGKETWAVKHLDNQYLNYLAS